MGHADGTAEVRDAATMQTLGSPVRLEHALLAVAWSPDGTMLLAGGVDGTAQVWAASTRSPIGRRMIHRGPIHSVAFSPDSRNVVTGSADHSARIWDSATGKPIGPPLDHGNAVVVGVGVDLAGNITTRTVDGVVRRWAQPAVADGSDKQFILWAQVATGSEIDASGVIHGLDPSDWHKRAERLRALGGPPSPENVTVVSDISKHQ